MENKEKLLLTESTKKIMDEFITEEELKTLDECEIVRRINKTKKLVAKLTESGQIEVKMVLFD